MHTRYLLAGSALFLALIGLALTFAPQEVLGVSDPMHVIPAQLLGAALCGFALLNWMSKGSPMGGIYGRPLAMGNLVHFTVGGLALAKVATDLRPSWPYMVVAFCYLLFAVLFARTAFFTSGPSQPSA